jgi:hypothetical protein
MANQNDVRDEVSDLLKRLDSISGIYKRAEHALTAEMSTIDLRRVRPEDAEDARKHCEHMYQSTRQAMLILLYSCLETGMDLVGNQFIGMYTPNVKKEKGEGSLKARLRVFKNSDIAFDLTQHEHECDIAETLRLVRNCLVHAAGQVEKSTEQNKLKEAIETLQQEARKRHTRFVEVRDGQLCLHKDVLALANCTSHDLILGLYDAAIRGRELT